MTALLRYAFVRSLRERQILALLFAPAVLLGAPLVIIAVIQLVRGQSAYPVAIDAHMPPLSTANMMGEVATFMGGLVAAVAAFWVFQREIASRAIGFFLLARRPHEVAATLVTYGTILGIASHLLTVVVIAAFTTHLPQHLAMQLGVGALSCLVTSAVGTASVSISPELSMVVPVYLSCIAITVALLKNHDILTIAGAVALFLAAAAIAPFLLRRRCAA